ncbi:hypothetical protein ABAC460_14400 [Asticcacaulis sp. AC460]|nr:hypothetical protein ABAC460_14400 [Asticcacaulis sp. AC460]
MLSRLAVAGGLVGLGGCEVRRHPSYTFKYTLTIKETTGLRQGSSVVKVNSSTSYGLGSGSHVTRKGDAAWVELSDGRLVVALMEGRGAPDYRPGWREGTDYLFMHLYGIEWNPTDAAYEKWSYQELARQRGTRRLAAEQMPILIVYDDQTDPDAYRFVDVANPAATLGGAVKSIAIDIAITDEPVRSGLKKKLPWLKDKSIYRVQTGRGGMPLSVGRHQLISD